MYHVFLQAGNTPLHVASMEGHVEAIDLLLNKRAKVNQTNLVSLHDLVTIKQLLRTHDY